MDADALCGCGAGDRVLRARHAFAVPAEQAQGALVRALTQHNKFNKRALPSLTPAQGARPLRIPTCPAATRQGFYYSFMKVLLSVQKASSLLYFSYESLFLIGLKVLILFHLFVYLHPNRFLHNAYRTVHIFVEKARQVKKTA